MFWHRKYKLLSVDSLLIKLCLRVIALVWLSNLCHHFKWTNDHFDRQNTQFVQVNICGLSGG